MHNVVRRGAVVVALVGLIGGGMALAGGGPVITDDVEAAFALDEHRVLDTEDCTKEGGNHVQRTDFYSGTVESDDPRLSGEIYIWAKSLVEINSTGYQDSDADDGVTVAKVVITQTDKPKYIKVWGGLLGVNEDSDNPTLGGMPPADDAPPHVEGMLIGKTRGAATTGNPSQTLPSGFLVANFTANTEEDAEGPGVLVEGVWGTEDSTIDSADNARERSDLPPPPEEDDADNPAIIQTNVCEDDDRDYDRDDYDDFDDMSGSSLKTHMPKKFRRLFK